MSAAMSSMSTSGIILLSPSLLSGSEFGSLSLAVMITMFASVAVNGLLGEVLLSSGKDHILSRSGEQADAAARLLSLLAAAFLILSGALLGVLGMGAVSTLLFNCAIALPPILMLTYTRTAMLAVGKHGPAMIIDAVWLLAWLFALLCLWFVAPSGSLNTTAVIASWSIPAVVAVGAVGGGRLRFRFRGSISWFRSSGRLGGSISGGNILYSTGAAAAVGFIASSVGLAQVGGLRFTQTVYGLGRVLYNAARLYYIPRYSSTAITMRPLVMLSALLALIPLCSFIFLTVALSYFPQIIDSDIRVAVQACLAPVGVASAAAAIAQGPLIGLRALRAARQLFFFRAFGGVLILGLPVGALVRDGGFEKAVWGLAIGELLTCAVGWLLLRRTMGRRD